MSSKRSDCRTTHRWFFAMLMFFTLQAFGCCALAQTKELRLALVIGNSVYANSEEALPGAEKDARSVAEALEKQRFIVTKEPNLTRRGIESAIKRFKAQLRAHGRNSIGFLYYAGHGGADRDNRDNFLIPVDAQVKDIAVSGVSVRWIQQELQELGASDDQPAAVVVVIDACRTLTQISRGRGISQATGNNLIPPALPMNKVSEPAPGFLFAFSTSNNQTASDSGDFAQALVKHISRQGLTIPGVFEAVQSEVGIKTNQFPIYQASFRAAICLVSCEAKIENALRCNSLRPADLSLAIRARNTERAIEVVQCRREFLASSEVRNSIASHFRSVDFSRSLPFLTHLKDGGVRILTDFRPLNPDRPEEYGHSPLRSSLFEWNSEAMSWLAAGGEADAWSAYPALLALRFRGFPVGNAQQQAQAIATVERALKAGLPTDFNDYEAFRLTYRAWLQTQISSEIRALGAGSRTREWEALFGDARPSNQADYWRSLSVMLQPTTQPVRGKVIARVEQEFVRPRLETLHRLENNLKQMLTGGGLRTIADPRHPLGGRNIDVPAGALQDGDLVVDGYGLLAAAGWAAVSQVKATIRGIDAAKQQFARLPTIDAAPR